MPLLAQDDSRRLQHEIHPHSLKGEFNAAIIGLLQYAGL